MNYFWHLIVMLSLYWMLGVSLNLVAGFLGLIALCHAAFYGTGAYVTTLLVMRGDLDFATATALSACFAALLSLAIALPSVRLTGSYFVLSSVGFQILVFSILYNWEALTNGPFGIAGIPVPRLLGRSIATPAEYASLCGVVAIAMAILAARLTSAPFGRVLKAVREDELAAAALGKNVPLLKIKAFAISAGLAAIPGALFASYARYIDPSSFTLTESIFVLAVVVIGGAGSQVGPLLGAVFAVLLPEALRFLELPDAAAGNVREIIYGLLLIALMRLRPRGIAGAYAFD